MEFDTDGAMIGAAGTDFSRQPIGCNCTCCPAISFLKNKPPGTFIIRNSNSFPGAFGLALRVARLPPNVQPKKKLSSQCLFVAFTKINLLFMYNVYRKLPIT